MLPPISVVVIGFNEAQHLYACFDAILASNYPEGNMELIYVDSGSTDYSVDIANKYTSSVYIEPEWPTAARNRNRGLIESKNHIVHFIDGDIVIDPDYLRFAVEKLLEGDVQVVCGYLEEKSIKGLGKILLHDYGNRKPGLIDAPGAGGTFIKSALVKVNGWDERIPRGEETEIGERLYKAGYKIWYLNKRMGIHDFGVKNISQFLKKQINEGLSLGAITKISSISPFIKNSGRISRNNLVFHLISLLLILSSVIFHSGGYIIIAFVLYSCYLYLKYRVIKKVKNPDSIKFYFLMNYTRSFVLYGFFKFRILFFFLPESRKISFQKRMDINFCLRNGTSFTGNS